MTAPTLQLAPAIRRRKSGSGWLPWLGGVAAGALMVAGPVYAFTMNKPASAATFDQPAAVAPSRMFPGMSLMYSGQGKFTVPGQVPLGTYSVAAGSSTFGCKVVLLHKDTDKPKDLIDGTTLNKGGFTSIEVTSEARVLIVQGDCIVGRA